MPKQLIVKGHTLPFEGRVYGYLGLASGPGLGRCSCGVTSGKQLPTTAARQRWHREHKQAVIDRLASEMKGGR